MQNPSEHNYFRPFFDWPTNNIYRVGKVHGLVAITKAGIINSSIEKPGTKPWIRMRLNLQGFVYTPEIVTDLNVWAQCFWANVPHQNGQIETFSLAVINNIKRLTEIEFLTLRDRDIIEDAFSAFSLNTIPRLTLPRLRLGTDQKIVLSACRFRIPNFSSSVR